MSEQQLTLKRKRHRTGFTPVPNDLLTNNQISGLAKALWCLLFSKPENWTFYWGEILSNFKEGRDAVKNARKELEKFGYLECKQVKRSMNGKMVFGGMEIELDDMPDLSALENKASVPITEIQLTESQSPEIQLTETPSTEKPSSYKDLLDKNLSKKNLSYFISLPLEEKRENLKKIWKEKNLKSDCEKYLLFREKSNWKGVTNLEADIAWWENGHKEKFPELHVEKKTNGDKASPIEEEPKEIQEVRGRFKFTHGNWVDNNDKAIFWQLFLTAKPEIIQTDSGFTVFISDESALKFAEVLAKINVKIEVK